MEFGRASGRGGLGKGGEYGGGGMRGRGGMVTKPDVITKGIVFVGVYGLYEVWIQLVKGVEKKRDAQLREEGYFDDEDDFADVPEKDAK